MLLPASVPRGRPAPVPARVMPAGWVLPARTTPRHPPAGKAHARQEHPSPSRSGCARSQKRSGAPMGHPSPCCRPGERLSSPRSARPSSRPSKRALPGTSTSPCHATRALPCHRAWPKGTRAVRAGAGMAGGLVLRVGRAGLACGQAAGAGMPGSAGKGDPGGMIYRGFIAVSTSAWLICAHKISSRWFSRDPSCWG